MLKSLEVKDYALIEHISIVFGKGLNIITGETGAGKSILIDALGLLLGERASTEAVRKGAQKSVVEGIFDVEGNKKVKSILEGNEIEYFPELIMRREISVKGTNRCFINDTPVPLSAVKELGNLLVDLHGQHEHQSLLRTETHIEFLDELSSIDELLSDYGTAYGNLQKLQHELKLLKEKEFTLQEKKEIYEFQIKEIDAVNPEEGEEERLTEELNILENSERLMELANSVYMGLYESENSIHDSLVRVKNELEELNRIDKSFTESNGECETALTLINDISEFVRSYRSRIDIDPEHLEGIRERLGALNLLKKKYGGSIKAIIEHREKIGREFELADNFSGSIKALQDKIVKARAEAGELAAELSKRRKKTAGAIEKEIEEALKSLGIEKARFNVHMHQAKAADSENYIQYGGANYRYNRSGFDEVEFFISTNAGEDTKPLGKVASGGEISRIMLALKTILAKSDKLPLLIFDEIDTGVSGRVAQKVGQALKQLASYHQIIAITHLPQIAGLADFHFAVKKSDVDERVVSYIRELSEDERVEEVAKLMSGEDVTEVSLAGARELMGIKK